MVIEHQVCYRSPSGCSLYCIKRGFFYTSSTAACIASKLVPSRKIERAQRLSLLEGLFTVKS